MAIAPTTRSTRQGRGVRPFRERRAALERLFMLPTVALSLGWHPLPVRANTVAGPVFSDNFRDMPLVDQDAKRFSFQQLKGRILLVHFIYTGCATACPIQTRALVEMWPRLPALIRQGVHIVSVTLDPLTDTPAALKTFGQRLGVDFTHWTMVTGRPDDTERVAKALRLFGEGPPQVQTKPKQPDSHATRIWLVDASGRLMQRYPGDPPDTRRLVREITQLASLAPSR